MDVQISQMCLQVSFGQAAYYFWAEHMQYCLFWEGSTWFGQIQNVQKYNLPNFEYYLKRSSTFDPLIKRCILARGLRI
jgi:hypothetical protein